LEEGEEDLSSYWMTLRKREYPGIRKLKHYITMCLEILAMEKDMDQSKTG